MNNFYIERHENDNLYFIFKRDNSSFNLEDKHLALIFLEENIKEKIKKGEFYGYSSFEDLDIKSSFVNNKCLSIIITLKKEKKMLKK